MDFGIGTSPRRVEDRRFLTGVGRYVDDLILPRQAYGVVVHSPYAAARIVSINTERALLAEGVLCVLTGADAKADGLGAIEPHLRPEHIGADPGFCVGRHLLVVDHVRCVGDRVAFIVAETEEQARDAADLLKVEYEETAPVASLHAAAAPGAPLVWDQAPGNVAFEIKYGDEAKTKAAFAGARHVVELRLNNNRVSANPIEPRAANGQYDTSDETYTLHCTSQNPHGVRSQLAHVFDIADRMIRVIAPDVGGGFGMKADPHPEDGLVLWAARRCGRPVKWAATRSESLLGDNHGRDQIVDGSIALDENGHILAIRARAIHGIGAYLVSAAVAPVNIGMRLIPNVYDVPVVDVVTRAIYSHTTPVGVYRGAGRPEATYLIERLIDRAADVTGIDRIELRRRNLIPSSAMPYRTATGLVYDTGEFRELMDECLQLADWEGYASRRERSKQRGKLRGRAAVCYIEQGGVFNDRMELRFDPSGGVLIVSGTLSHGQGHATVYAQIVSEWLGIPLNKIQLLQGDTHKVPLGRGTYAARSSLVASTALRSAADQVIERCRKMAAHMLEADAGDITFDRGRFLVAGTDRALMLPDVVKGFYQSTHLAAEFGVGLDVAGYHSSDDHNFPNGCHVCEVEIDAETGMLEIAAYTCVDDIGNAINPMICEGQLHGGIAQGIGQATLEHILYDPSGQLLSGSFQDYAMPRAKNMPSFVQKFRNVPSTGNPLGLKGIGEAGTIAPPPAIVNAALDALKDYDVTSLEMPLTASRISDVLRKVRRV